MAAISCDGEVGDGAEVAAAEALSGFGEGSVGLDAERDASAWRASVVRPTASDSIHCFATHGSALLPAAAPANAAGS